MSLVNTKVINLSVLALLAWLTSSTLAVTVFLLLFMIYTWSYVNSFTKAADGNPITVCEVGFVDRCIKALFGNSIIYNMSWEDPRLDRSHLHINENDHIIMLTSAGCNVLDYLIENPEQIVAVDLNSAQNYFLELRIAGIKTLTHEEFFSIFAESDTELLQSVYHTKLRTCLSIGAKEYWDPRIPKITNMLYLGSSGYFANWLVWFMGICGMKEFVNAVRSGANMETIRIIYNRDKGNMFTIFKALSFIIEPLYRIAAAVPNNQGTDAKLVHFALDVFDYVIDRTDIMKDNYFCYGYLAGKYTRDNCPRFMRSEYFQVLKSRIDRIKIFHGFLTDALDRYPQGWFTVASLLDHMDWLTSEQKSHTFTSLYRKMAPDARIWWRSFFPEFHNNSQFALWNKTQIHPELDRVPTYQGTFIATKRKNAIDLPRPDYAPSATWKDDFTTIYYMWGHPFHKFLNNLRGYDAKTHSDSLEAFYEKQAVLYDGYRHRMLHGRKPLMQMIPFKDGDVWIDIGGGTASNIEYIIPLIPRLKQVIIVDLSQSLLNIARKRVEQHNLQDKVKLICADATQLNPADFPPANIVTISYALTMIPDWKKALDVAYHLLLPEGLFGLADFTVTDTLSPYRRWFWVNLFRNDGVHLNTEHLPALDSRYTRLYYTQEEGGFPYAPMLLCPYHVFIGRKDESLVITVGNK